MDFLKENCFKILTSIVFLALFVTFGIFALNTLNLEPITPVLTKEAINAALFTQLTVSIGSLLIAIATILAMFDKTKDYKKFALIATSVIALIFVILAAVNGGDTLSALADRVQAAKDLLASVPETAKPAAQNGVYAAQLAYNQQLAPMLVNIVMFVVTPLVFGLKGLFGQKNK